MIKVYTIGCPACNVLEKKLKQNNIEYESVNDLALFKEKGITKFPMMEKDGCLLSFTEAIEWLKNKQ